MQFVAVFWRSDKEVLIGVEGEELLMRERESSHGLLESYYSSQTQVIVILRCKGSFVLKKAVHFN
jgi:hypothetical protein